MSFTHCLSLLTVALALLFAGCSESQDTVIEIDLSVPVLEKSIPDISSSTIGIRWAASENAKNGYSCTVTGDNAPSSPIIVKPEGNGCRLFVDGLAPAMEYTVSVYAIGFEEQSGSSHIVYRQSGTSSISVMTFEKQEEDDENGGTGGEIDKPHPSAGKACRGWFELPAQKDDDHNGIDDSNSDLYYSWTMRADMNRIRNFSACYSKGKMHPVWVAAPMHECYTGGSGRSEAYQDDPAIKCSQSPKFEGYTRGHMLGSSDRTVSKPTNAQAFYYSNIGAQLQSGFNEGAGAWNNLEKVVEGQWCADTLYQVIGCIFEDFTDAYGANISKRTVPNGSYGSFQMPTAWYKVLLRTKNGNSGKRVDQCSADELKCCAFILAHKGAKNRQPSSKDIYSVAYVEKLTGLDFFVNVPNAPKSTVNPSDWL